jgi:hypothetical protein
MNLNPLDLLNSLLAMVATIPVAGPVLAKIAAIALIVSAVVTALIGVWHSVIKVVQALGMVALAAKLQAYDDEAEGVLNKYVLPILDRLSLIKVPQKP